MLDLFLIFFASWVAGLIVAETGLDRIVGRAVMALLCAVDRFTKMRGLVL